MDWQYPSRLVTFPRMMGPAGASGGVGVGVGGAGVGVSVGVGEGISVGVGEGISVGVLIASLLAVGVAAYEVAPTEASGPWPANLSPTSVPLTSTTSTTKPTSSRTHRCLALDRTAAGAGRVDGAAARTVGCRAGGVVSGDAAL